MWNGDGNWKRTPKLSAAAHAWHPWICFPIMKYRFNTSTKTTFLEGEIGNQPQHLNGYTCFNHDCLQLQTVYKSWIFGPTPHRSYIIRSYSVCLYPLAICRGNCHRDELCFLVLEKRSFTRWLIVNFPPIIDGVFCPTSEGWSWHNSSYHEDPIILHYISWYHLICPL